MSNRPLFSLILLSLLATGAANAQNTPIPPTPQPTVADPNQPDPNSPGTPVPPTGTPIPPTPQPTAGDPNQPDPNNPATPVPPTGTPIPPTPQPTVGDPNQPDPNNPATPVPPTGTPAPPTSTPGTPRPPTRTPTPHLGCVRSPGYWKSHPSLWPASSLGLGDETYSKAELLPLLNEVLVDASRILARQLIAAKLNILSGADAAVISGVIAASDDWLDDFAGKLPYNVPPWTPRGLVAIQRAAQLTLFNYGALPGGPPTCDAGGSGLTRAVEVPVGSRNGELLALILVIASLRTARSRRRHT